MFKSLESWFGTSNQNGGFDKESVQDQKWEVNNASVVEEGQQTSQNNVQAQQKPKGLSSYVYDFASSASKKLSETAQSLKKSVEDGKINVIIDKTILGDFQKEQEKFVQEKKAKSCSAAVPPWVGYYEEETIQHQILSLSADKRNFLRDPPAGVQFQFDYEQMYPVAMVMLEEDELLRKMRFHLVPKEVKEEVFWKNYFYRISLIKQSAQLTALAAQQAKEKPSRDDARRKDEKKIVISKSEPDELKEERSTSPTGFEFASDAFDSSSINGIDLRKEMEQLVLDEKGPPDAKDDIADWEKELQEELQEYDVVVDSNDNHDDNWDKEIEEMLKEDS
ncbi:synapse-associated protein 1-like [Neosynchiropus ocellatus]